MTDTPVFDFSSCRVISEWFKSDALVRVMNGPVGSAKSTAHCLEIQRRAFMQAPSKDGMRRFTAGIVRATSPQLVNTTLRTWHSIFPPNAPYVKFKYAPPMCYQMKMPPQGDEPGIDLTVDFFAMDDEKQAEKLLSYECSMLWINEGREVMRKIVDRAIDRVGRFPSLRHPNVGCTWRGVIIDTNPPDDDHWLAEMDLGETPETWDYFNQPPAVLEMKEVEIDGKRAWTSIEPGYTLDVTDENHVMRAAGTWWAVNPEAENIYNLPAPEIDGKRDPMHKTAYYLSGCASKDRDYIRTYYQGKYGANHEGKPVIPEFRPDLQVVSDVQPLPSLPVYAGADVGAGTINPAAVLAQRFPRGNIVVFDEIFPPDEGVGLKEFTDEIKFRLSTVFHGCRFERGWGDPAGMVRDGFYEQTTFEFFQQAGLRIMPAPSNDPRMRIHAIKSPCLKLIDGKPGLIIHSRCKNLIKGLKGGWQFKRVKMGGSEERYKDAPDKNKYSHPCDALGYMLIGMGEGKAFNRRDEGAVPTHAKTNFSVLG